MDTFRALEVFGDDASVWICCFAMTQDRLELVNSNEVFAKPLLAEGTKHVLVCELDEVLKPFAMNAPRTVLSLQPEPTECRNTFKSKNHLASCFGGFDKPHEIWPLRAQVTVLQPAGKNNKKLSLTKHTTATQALTTLRRHSTPTLRLWCEGNIDKICMTAKDTNE